MPPVRESLRASAAAVTTVVLWAAAFVVIRSVGHDIAPGPLALVRQLSGMVVLGVVALRYRRPLPRGRSLGLVLGYGLLWFAGYTVVLALAEHHLDPGTAALLVNVGPILVAVVAGLTMGEGFPRPLVVGMVVAVLGVLTIAAGSSGGSGVSDGLGVALGLCAAVLYASGVLLQKLALRTVDAVTATWVGCAAGALATLPFAGQAWSEMGSVPMSDVLWVVFLGVGPTALAFTTWAYALSRADAGRMAATTLVVPALATLMSWLALGEVPTPLGFAGGALALAGVGITRLRRRPGVPPAPPTAEQGGSALEMRPSCERCGTALPPESDAARICAHECTFCAPCAEATDGRCPNCRGVLRHRPSLIAEPG